MEIPRYAEGAYAKYYVSVNLNCFTPTSFITTIRKGGWEGDVMGDFEWVIFSYPSVFINLPFIPRMGLSKSGTMCFKGFECPIGEVMSSKMFRNPVKFEYKMQRMYADAYIASGILLEVTIWWVERSSRIVLGGGIIIVYSRNGFPTCREQYRILTTVVSSPELQKCYLGKEKPLTNAIAKFIPGSLPRRPGRAAMRTRLQVEPNGLDHVDEIVMSLWIVERTRTVPSGIMKDLF